MPEQKKKTSGTSASNKSKTNTRRSTRKSANATTDAGSSKKRQRSGSQSSAFHRKRSQLSRAQEVKRLKILIAAVTAAVLIIGGLLIHRLLFPINKGSLNGVSDEVLQYQASMEKA